MRFRLPQIHSLQSQEKDWVFQLNLLRLVPRQLMLAHHDDFPVSHNVLSRIDKVRLLAGLRYRLQLGKAVPGIFQLMELGLQ